MNTLERSILYREQTRIVNGIAVLRDADVGIVFEKSAHLDLAGEFLRVSRENFVFYDGWDRHVLHHTLGNGAIVALTYAHGPAYAASAVERMARTGTSHIVRIGTCGALSGSVGLWDVVVSYAAIRDEGTTDAYLPKTVPSVAHLPLTQALFEELNRDRDLRTHLGVALTNGARYCEDPEKMKMLVERARAVSVDMETAVILLVSSVLGIAASSVSVAMDTPTQESLDPGLLGGARFHGTTDHGAYRHTMPGRITSILCAALATLETITSQQDYPLLVANARFDHDRGCIRP